MSRSRTLHDAHRYIGALALLGLATLTRLALQPILDGRQPFIAIYLAVILSAWFLGLGPSILVAASGAFIGTLLFVEPMGFSSYTWPADLLLLSNYFILSGAVIALSERQRRARLRLVEEMEERRHAEAAVRASEARFQQLTSMIADVFWMADLRAQRLVYISSAYERVWNRPGGEDPEEDVLWPRAVHPEDRERVAAEFQRAATTGTFDVRYRIVRPDGTLRWLRDRGYGQADAAGRVVLLAGIAEDVTERLNAEEQLQRLRLLSDHANDAHFVVDRDGGFLYANEVACGRLGYDRGRLLTLGAADLEPGGPEGRFATALERGFETTVPPFETELRGADGVTFPVEIALTRIPFDGGPRLLAVVRDITERKRNEAALRASEQRFRTLADTLPQIVWTAGPDGAIDYVNARWLEYTGMTSEEAFGREGWKLSIHPDDVGRLERSRADALAAGGIIEDEFRIRRQDGEYRWHLVRSVPVLDAAGNLVQRFGTATDIHARRLAEETLRRREQELRLALEAGRMGTWEWDIPSGGIRWSDNLEEIHGLPPGGFDATFSGFLSIVHPEDRPRIEHAIARTVEERSRFDVEFRVLRPDGSIHWMAGKGKVFTDDEDRPARMIGLGIDISGAKRAEERLRESEERFRQLADNSTDVFWVASLDPPVMLYVSPAFAAIWGRSPDPQAGSIELFLETVVPEDRDRVRAGRHRVRDGDAWSDTYRIVRPDGTIRWIWDRAFPIRDPRGNVIREAGIAADVTERRQAEQALRDSEQTYRFLAEGLPLFIATAGPDGRFDYFNSAWREFTGLGIEETNRGDWVDLLHPEHRSRVPRTWSEGIGAGDPFEIEYCIRRATDGEYRWHLARAEPLRDPAGASTGWVVAALDITDRKNAEEALRRAETRFRVAQESSLFGFTILRSVRSDGGRIVDFEWEYVNPAAARMLSTTPEGLLGSRLLERFPGCRDQADLFDRYVRVVETGEPHDLELRYDADGIDGWFRNMAVKLDDGLAISFSDVSERRSLESDQRRLLFELEARNAFIEAVFRQVPAGILVAEAPSGRLLLSNREAERIVGHPYSYGHTLEEHDRLAGIKGYHPDSTLYAPGDWPLDRALRDGEVVTAEEIELERPDASRLTISVNAGPISGSDGQVIAAVAAFHDVSERRRLEGELRQRAADLAEDDRRKDEFLATLAHELRNPLAPIRNAVRVLHIKGPPDPQLQWARDVIDRQVAQMARLLDDLLDISRITRNKLELRRQKVDLATVVQLALETSRPLIEAAGHRLDVLLPDSPVPLDADPTRLAQVFSNLLNNAAKYSDPGSHIRLSAELRAQEVIVSVVDTGIGIAPEHLPQLFEMFSQVTPAIERSQGGLGIGLALVRGLVEMHQGRVEAYSEGPGAGSTFRVRLPLALAAPVPEPEQALLEDPAPKAGRARVLVVDDNVDAAATLAMMLRLQGHEVAVAHDGPEAVAQARAFRPELILLDLGLPGLNGYEVARQVRAFPWGKEVRIVALTGWGQESDRSRSKEAGFDDHLVKPVEIAAIESLLASPNRPVASNGTAASGR